mmetsp:Transcript_9645/g.30572  ORF Transcript_9645/g.30572 Transcript_9645/m.30572 type:complete len:203 (-) Transcript_9645:107-715(-)
MGYASSSPSSSSSSEPSSLERSEDASPPCGGGGGGDAASTDRNRDCVLASSARNRSFSASEACSFSLSRTSLLFTSFSSTACFSSRSSPPPVDEDEEGPLPSSPSRCNSLRRARASRPFFASFFALSRSRRSLFASFFALLPFFTAASRAALSSAKTAAFASRSSLNASINSRIFDAYPIAFVFQKSGDDIFRYQQGKGKRR